MLTFDQVTLTQGTFHLAAHLTIPTGITAIIGPSGGGKSTLLAAIAGFIAPTAGDILWNDKSLSKQPPGERPASMLFQDNNLFPHLTIEQNVSLGIRPDLKLSTAQKETVAKTLTQVGLTDLGSRKPNALSGGQQSRAALARVLVSDRPLVLLDEPFAALGPALKDEMLELVTTTLAAAGKSIVMVTHDPDDARRIADRVVLVAVGKAHPSVDGQQIFDDPPAALKAYLG